MAGLVVPRVAGNFQRNIENISADVQQEHGFLEVVREAIPNATDHGATRMHLAVFTTPDETAVLFVDNGDGMDASPLLEGFASGAQSSIHSFFCYGQSTNVAGNGATGRFCAGVKAIMHAASSGLVMTTRTRASGHWLTYDTEHPIQDIVESEAGRRDIHLTQSEDDPLAATRARLRRMSEGDDVVMENMGRSSTRCPRS